MLTNGYIFVSPKFQYSIYLHIQNITRQKNFCPDLTFFINKTINMKKLILLLATSCTFCSMLVAQTNPEGMNYQAVARNTKGEILADQPIALKVILFSVQSTGKIEYYSEVHDVVTSATGVFSLVVGKGKKESGVFETVPWSKENIWMQVSIKSKGQSDFVTISNSKLLAVPYAFYAATAGQVAALTEENSASSKDMDLSKCPCEGGISQVKVLYLGPSGVTINVYGKKDQRDLLVTFNGVINGTILTVNANNYPDGKFKNETFFEVLSQGISMVEINTECEELKKPWEVSLGETIGNFSVLSHRDKKNNAECTVCDIKKEWHVGGNGLMDLCNWLGTKSNTELILITNNIPRQTIAKDGNISIKRSLKIGADLNVDSTVKLNILGGETINHGMFSVDGATDLNSTLNVDGITNLNSNLNVNNARPTKLTGTLTVDGITDLNAALSVKNTSPTLLTGTLQVIKDALFKEKVFLDNATYQSTSPTTGALVVNGGLGLGGNLNIGGSSAFGGAVSFAGAVGITDLTESTSTSTGALIVGGGIGIGKRLNVLGGGLFSSTLGVAGITTLSNVTESTGTGNGALLISGGASIAKNLNIGGALTTAGITTFNNTLNVNASSSYIANFVNSTSANGISIQVGAGIPTNSNDFVTFKKSSGAIVGRIEGETLSELNVNPEYVNEKNAFIFEVTTGSVDLAIAAFEIAQGVVDVVASASSSTACVGLGACITAPIPSFIIAAGTSLVLKIANAASAATSLAGAITTRNAYVSNKENNLGVTYQSGSADYAEWLPKNNPSDKFLPGYVVGLKNGRISINTAGAEKLFVISTKPIVLGNMPATGNETDFEKVAFMGQVPVQVLGKVNTGDYILPSGKNNGLAKAVSPDKMKPEDYIHIVGVAWSASSNDIVSTINVAIGLNTGDISKVVAEQSKEISSLRTKVDETNSILAKLIPGFKEAAGISGKDIVNSKVPVPTNTTHQDHTTGIVKADAGDIVYFNVTPDQLNAMFAMAEKIFLENGGDANTDPFWKRMKSEPGFKEATMQQVNQKFTNALHTHQQINKQYLGDK